MLNEKRTLLKWDMGDGGPAVAQVGKTRLEAEPEAGRPALQGRGDLSGLIRANPAKKIGNLGWKVKDSGGPVQKELHQIAVNCTKLHHRTIFYLRSKQIGVNQARSRLIKANRGLPVGSRRYSRLEICATGRSAQRGSFKHLTFSDWLISLLTGGTILHTMRNESTTMDTELTVPNND
jgi:hypothetical protein